MDEELQNLKRLYHQKKAVVSKTHSEAKAEGDRQLKKSKYHHLKNVFVFLATAAVIIYADAISAQKINTSATGFWIMLGCAFYHAATKWLLFRKLQTINPDLPVLEMIGQLEAYKKQHLFLQTYAQYIYVIVLSIGVYLYLTPILEALPEMISPRYVKFTKFIWVAFLAWAFVHTFFIRRNRLLADNKMLKAYIQSLKSVE